MLSPSSLLNMYVVPQGLVQQKLFVYVHKIWITRGCRLLVKRYPFSVFFAIR